MSLSNRIKKAMESAASFSPKPKEPLLLRYGSGGGTVQVDKRRTFIIIMFLMISLLFGLLFLSHMKKDKNKEGAEEK